MTWLLVFFLLTSDGLMSVTSVGLINGHDLCQVTGAALAQKILREEPGARVTWTCADQAGVMS